MSANLEIPAGKQVVGYQGEWMPLFFAPDIASPQEFVVGVVAGSAARIDGFRLLHDFDKFGCVYGRRFSAENTLYLFDRLRNALQGNLKKRDAIPSVGEISPQLRFGDALFLAGDTVDAAINNVYESIVALEPTPGPAKPKRFESRDSERVRTDVFNALKIITGLRYNEIIVEQGFVTEKDDTGMHRLSLQIHTPKVCGAIASAWYSEKESVERSVLRAYTDLITAQRMYHSRKAGLFLQRPVNPKGVSDLEAGKIDVLIDDVAWKVKRAGAHFDVHESAEDVALAIKDFAG